MEKPKTKMPSLVDVDAGTMPDEWRVYFDYVGCLCSPNLIAMFAMLGDLSKYHLKIDVEAIAEAQKLFEMLSPGSGSVEYEDFELY